MMFYRLDNIHQKQEGFTILELLIAVAISGLIIGGIALTIAQLFEGHAQSSGEMTALREVQNVGFRVNRDGQMAHDVSVVDDPGTEAVEVITLTWYEYYWDEENPSRHGDAHRVIYTFDPESGKVNRDYYFAGYPEDETPYEFEFQGTAVIAEYIESMVALPLGNNYELTVTATTGGFQSQSETRTYEIKPRPETF